MELPLLGLLVVLAGFATTFDLNMLNAPNVCLYKIASNKSRTKIETFRTTTNCPNQREECEVLRSITVFEPVTEQALSCCAGWIASGNNCSIPCPADRYGRYCSETCNCTAPNTKCFPVTGCNCDVGWKPPNCTSKCDPGSYGFECTKECSCMNGTECDPVTGQCACTPGWTGPVCNTTCPRGRFGGGCAMNCSCEADRAVCHHVSGECSCETGWSGPNCDVEEGYMSSTLQGTLVDETANATDLLMHGDQDMVRSYPDYRLVFIIVPVVAGISIIIGAFAVMMYHISKHHGRDEKLTTRNFHPSARVMNLGPIVTGGMGSTSDSAQTAQTRVISLRVVDSPTSPPTDPMLPVDEPIPERAQEGTSRRNNRDKLPAIDHDFSQCSWAWDENAYCELGPQNIHNEMPKAEGCTLNPVSMKYSTMPSADSMIGMRGLPERRLSASESFYHILEADSASL